jgi:hypothetical protein
MQSLQKVCEQRNVSKPPYLPLSSKQISQSIGTLRLERLSVLADTTAARCDTCDPDDSWSARRSTDEACCWTLGSPRTSSDGWATRSRDLEIRGNVVRCWTSCNCSLSSSSPVACDKDCTVSAALSFPLSRQRGQLRDSLCQRSIHPLQNVWSHGNVLRPPFVPTWSRQTVQ